MSLIAAANSTTIEAMPANISDVGESDTVYNELLSFLSSPRSDLRRAAAEATLATLVSSNADVSKEEGHDQPSPTVINNEAAQRLTSLNAIQPLCKIASAASPDAGSIEALAALTVLCSHELVGNQCVVDFVKARGIGRMIEISLSNPPSSKGATSEEDWKKWRQQVNYASALLANATRAEEGAVDFIGRAFPEEAIPSSLSKETNPASLEDGKEKNASSETKNTSTEAPPTLEKKEAKPTATLLLSRFLNPSFIDTSSPLYKSSLDEIKPSELDEYNSDLEDDEEKLNEETKEQDLQPQKVEPMGEEYYDPYQHVAAVMMNITQLETGRNFLMKLIHKKSPTAKDGKSKESNGRSDTTTTSHLQSLLPQLNSPNLHRRQGIAGTLKNCCFSQDSVWWLLNVVHLDKSLLMPLAGPEELTIDEKVGLDPDYWLMGPQKVREPDSLVRLYLVEALLLLLASGRRARETLRERRMYVVIKLADMVEENEEVSERMLECVQYLRRDEEGEEEGSSDRRAYERYAQGMLENDTAKNLKALPPSTSDFSGEEKVEVEDENFDNID